MAKESLQHPIPSGLHLRTSSTPLKTLRPASSSLLPRSRKGRLHQAKLSLEAAAMDSANQVQAKSVEAKLVEATLATTAALKLEVRDSCQLRRIRNQKTRRRGQQQRRQLEELR